ncbi:conserved Plasmodium protein, unknown function [Plasmodium relictum]|uniref:Uncharacterized protein n=1 Tax=Plasmodium relictum TaxID=85471 RepID=A0A1J1HGP1_PLARL|nr:conserved Plasmodium protein, unknown function [Plasmodium relictum]CRH03005.1 conserved Plasmodium protein, unknown function [Plasmodium relictum]
MSKSNTVRCDMSAYKRNKCYNPKVHVSGWYDIQNDEDYIESYNRMKDFHLQEYPTYKIEEKYKNMKKKCIKNISDKDVIFYQDHGTEYWVTENKESYKVNNKIEF